MQLPESWDTIAASYASEIAAQMAPFADEALRLASVAPTERVLDVACGPGTLTFRAAPLVRQVVAVDFSPGMVAEVSARAQRDGLTNVEAKVMDAQALAFPDGAFDTAFSMFSFMFFPDRARAFRELLRVLRPGGIAVVGTWGPIDRRPMMKLGFDAVAEVLPDLPRPAKGDLQDPAECVREMSEAGFEGVVSAPYTASVHFTPDEYMKTVVLAGPIAMLRKKIGDAAFQAATKGLSAAVRKRMPDEGATLAAEAILTRGTRPVD